MSLNARMSENDPRLYNVNRDVAHNFDDVMRLVADRLEDGNWPILVDIIEKYGVTQDMLGEACRSFCTFVYSAADDKTEKTMKATLARVGWNDVPPVAQVALMAILGTVISGYFYAGVREVTMGGVGPCLGYRELKAVGDRCSKAMATSPFRRRLGRLRAFFLRIKDAVSQRPEPGWRYGEYRQQYAAAAAQKVAQAEASRKRRTHVEGEQGAGTPPGEPAGSDQKGV